MTIEEINKALDSIREAAASNEITNSFEGDLLWGFTYYVATIDNPLLAAKARSLLRERDAKLYRKLLSAFARFAMPMA
jgi:hypothetical protein